jgi:hypothetical protein
VVGQMGRLRAAWGGGLAVEEEDQHGGILAGPGQNWHAACGLDTATAVAGIFVAWLPGRFLVPKFLASVVYETRQG